MLGMSEAVLPDEKAYGAPWICGLRHMTGREIRGIMNGNTLVERPKRMIGQEIIVTL